MKLNLKSWQQHKERADGEKGGDCQSEKKAASLTHTCLVLAQQQHEAIHCIPLRWQNGRERSAYGKHFANGSAKERLEKQGDRFENSIHQMGEMVGRRREDGVSKVALIIPKIGFQRPSDGLSGKAGVCSAANDRMDGWRRRK